MITFYYFIIILRFIILRAKDQNADSFCFLADSRCYFIIRDLLYSSIRCGLYRLYVNAKYLPLNDSDNSFRFPTFTFIGQTERT